ncbi:hypothetical protein INT45_008359 [Circinella minor]|uniref:NADH-ubiquinone oxidoreductase chain 6 n=1 Tax=Circinella minor TaxID=1195481 RepID=A0A8H7RY54_9FUNG|nr:hypothetical protein INT45_008359 [Circinella minor]
MNAILLDLLTFGSVLSGILVITSRNPIISVLFLIAVFVNVACYLILLAGEGLATARHQWPEGDNYLIEIIRLSTRDYSYKKSLGEMFAYLIVYVGAIAILFLFVVMMLNIKLVELQDSAENSSNPYPLAFVLGTLFVSGLSLTNPNITKFDLPTIFDSINLLSFKSDKLETLFVNHLNWDNLFVSLDQINSLGQVLYTSHALFLIIASMILLLAMVGPIILSLNPTKRVLIVIVPLLMSVAFITIAERKAMGSMQRRLGPNKVGYYGLLQPLSQVASLN